MSGVRARALRPIVLGACLLLVIAGGVAGAEYISRDSAVIGADETIEGDLYFAGRSLVVDGTIEGDVVAAANDVTVNGEVTGSVNAAGAVVTVNGTVGGAVRAGTATLVINGAVGRDVVVFGGQASLTGQGRVAGDVAGALGTLQTTGDVGGDLRVSSGSILIGGSVDGSVDVQVDQLTLDSDARIGGDVRYTSDREATIDPGASIAGATRRTDPADDPVTAPAANPVLSFLGAFLFQLFFLLIIGWSMLLIRPVATGAIGAQLRTRPLLSLGAGAAAWIGQFLLLLLLILIGALLAAFADPLAGALFVFVVVLVLLVVILAVVSEVYVAMAVAAALFARRGWSRWLAYALGAGIVAIVLSVAGLIHGVLGFVVYLLAWIVGLGALALYHLRARQIEEDAALASGTPAAPVAEGG